MTGKRFKEIVSTQKVVDTVTNKEYDCLLDNDLFELINTIAEENEQLKEQNEFLQKRLDCIIQSLQNDLNNYGMMGRCE